MASSSSPVQQLGFVVEHNATLFGDDNDDSDMFPFTITQYDSISTPTHYQLRSTTVDPPASSSTAVGGGGGGGATPAPSGASFSQDDSTTTYSLFPVVTPPPPTSQGRLSIHAPTPTSGGGGLAEYAPAGQHQHHPGSSSPASSVSGFLHPFGSGAGGGPQDPRSRSMSSHDVLAKIQELELSRQTKVLVSEDRSGFLLEMAKHEHRLAELVHKKVERCQHLHFLEDVRTTRGVPTEDRPSGSHYSKRMTSLLQKTVPTATTITHSSSSSSSSSRGDVENDSSSSDTGDDEPLEGVRDRITKTDLHTAAVETMKQNSLRGGPQWGSVAFEAGVQAVERELWAAHLHKLDQAPSPLILKYAAPVLNHDLTPVMLNSNDVHQRRAIHAEEVFQSRKASRLNLHADVSDQKHHQGDTTAPTTVAAADGHQVSAAGTSPTTKPSKYQSQHHGRLPPIATLTAPPSIFRPKTADSTTTITASATRTTLVLQDRRPSSRVSLKKLTQHSRPASAASCGSSKPINVEWEQLDAAHVMLVRYRGVLDDLEREEAEHEKERIRLSGVSILDNGSRSGKRVSSSTKRTNSKKSSSTSRRHNRQRRHQQQQKGLSSPAGNFMDSLANEEVMGESFFTADHDSPHHDTHTSITHHDADDDDHMDDNWEEEDGVTSFAELISSTEGEDEDAFDGDGIPTHTSHHDNDDFESGEDDWYVQHVNDRKHFQREAHVQKQHEELVRLYGPLLARPSSSSIPPRPASASMLRPTTASDISREVPTTPSKVGGVREPLSLLDVIFTKDDEKHHSCRRRGSHDEKGSRRGRASGGGGSMSMEGRMASSALVVLSSSSSSSDVDDRPFSSGSGRGTMMTRRDVFSSDCNDGGGVVGIVASPTVEYRSSILIPQHLSASDLSHIRPPSSSIKTPTPKQARLQERGRLPPMRSALGAEGGRLSPSLTSHHHAPPPPMPVSSRHRPQSSAARVVVPPSPTHTTATAGGTDNTRSMRVNKAPKKITRPWSADGRVTSTYWRNWSAMKKLEDLEKSREAATRPNSRGYWHNTDDTTTTTTTSLPPTPNTSSGRPKSSGRLGSSSSAQKPPRPATSSARVSAHPSRGTAMSGVSGAVVNSIRLDGMDEEEYAISNTTVKPHSSGLPPRPQSTGTQKNVRFATDDYSPPPPTNKGRPTSSSGNNAAPTYRSVPQLMGRSPIDTTTTIDAATAPAMNSTSSLQFQHTDGNDMSGFMRGSALEVLALVDDSDGGGSDRKVGDLSIGSVDINSSSEQQLPGRGGPLSAHDASPLSPPRTAPHGSSKASTNTTNVVPPPQSRFVLQKRLPSRVSSAPANRAIGTTSTSPQQHQPPKTSHGFPTSTTSTPVRITTSATPATPQARPSSAAAHLNAVCRRKLDELEGMPLDLFRARERVSNNPNISSAATNVLLSGQGCGGGGGEDLAVLLHAEAGRKAFYDQLLQGVKRDRDAVYDSYRPTHVFDSEGGVVPRTYQSTLQARALSLGIDAIKMGVELKLLRFDEARSSSTLSPSMDALKEEAQARSEFLRASALVIRTGRIPAASRMLSTPTNTIVDIKTTANEDTTVKSTPSAASAPPKVEGTMRAQPTPKGDTACSPLLSPTFNDRQDYALIRSYAHQLTPNIFLRSPAQLRDLTVITTPRSIKDSTAKAPEDPFMSLVNTFVSDEMRHMEQEDDVDDESPENHNHNQEQPNATPSSPSSPVYSVATSSKRLKATIVDAERRYLEVLNMLSASNLDLQRRCATTIQRAFRKWMATWSDEDSYTDEEGEDVPGTRVDPNPATTSSPQLSPTSEGHDFDERNDDISSFSMDDEFGDDITAALTSPPW